MAPTGQTHNPGQTRFKGRVRLHPSTERGTECVALFSLATMTHVPLVQSTLPPRTPKSLIPLWLQLRVQVREAGEWAKDPADLSQGADHPVSLPDLDKICEHNKMVLVFTPSFGVILRKQWVGNKYQPRKVTRVLNITKEPTSIFLDCIVNSFSFCSNQNQFSSIAVSCMLVA